MHFRKRIDTERIQKIFTYSVGMHPGLGRSAQALSDTTVQENNTTFRTDAKLAKKARKARKKLRTIAGQLIRELKRELPPVARVRYQEDLQLYRRGHL